MNNEKEFKDLPEGWKWARLGEVGEIIMGQSPASALVNQERNGIPFLQGSAEFGVKYPLPKNWIVKPIKIAPIGSILISVRAPVGDINISNNVYGIGRGLSAIKINDSKANNLFIWHNIYFYRNELVKISQGSTFEAVGYKELNNFLIPLPPLPEQQKIAEILETVDNVIEKTDRIIEKYKRIKQGLMQDLLTKGIDESGNIRSEKTHKFKDSTLGRIPDEWAVVRLGEVGEIVSGSTPSTYNYEYWNGKIVWITPNDLSNIEGIFIEDSSRKITQKGLKSCSAKIISADSVVVSSRAPIGYVKVSKVPFATNQGCKSIEYNGKFSPVFLAFLLSNKVQNMINLGSGTTFQEITKSNLANIPIPLPPLPEQQRIAEILSQIDETIEKEEQYKEKLERIKQGLMEDLLTGKVRVNHLIKKSVKNVSTT